MKRSTLGHIVIIALFAVACNPVENIIPKPEVSVSNEAIINWNGCLKGSVLGVEPNMYYVTVYVKINGLWNSPPDKSTINIPISEENEWMCMPVALEFEQVSEAMIFLLPNRFTPPILDREKSIPVKLNLVSVAVHNIRFGEPI